MYRSCQSRIDNLSGGGMPLHPTKICSSKDEIRAGFPEEMSTSQVLKLSALEESWNLVS